MRTIYHNARVYTGELPLAQAFLVEDGRFISVGSDGELLAERADARVDLKGAFVCAGFNDSHMHLLGCGQQLSIAPLARHTSSLEDMIACLSRAEPGPGGWILGRGWNQDHFSGEKRMPTRWDLDRVSTVLPVCATRACGHALSVNSRALELLGVGADTPQMDGGCIVMENGVPNGVFLDNAMELVQGAIPPPDKAQLKEMLRRACRALNAYGVTSCQSDDYCVFKNLPWQSVNEAFRELEQEGELLVRVCEQANFADPDAFAAFADAIDRNADTDFFRIGPLKLLGDGALGARSAYLSAPYRDDPGTRGLSVFSAEAFDRLIGDAHARGMQAAVHCIGDACLDLVLDSFEKALSAHPRKDHRHGIVHCQITRPDQLDRLARLGLHIYAQSIFLDYDIHIVAARVGEELAASSYSWKTLMRRGCRVSNGSDGPVELPNALAGMQCAVTRCDLQGRGPYLPGEAFTVQEALDSYTIAGAYASFEEDRKGRIAPGMLADFVVLGDSPFDVEPGEISRIPVLETYLGGKKVY